MEWLGHVLILFSHLRNHQTVFQSCSTALNPQGRLRVPASHLLTSTWCHPEGGRWHLTVDLICMNHCFVVSSGVEKCESSSCVLFQDSLGYSGSLAITYKLWIRIGLSVSAKEPAGILTGTVLIYSSIWRVLTMLTFQPVDLGWMLSDLLRSLISFSNVL